MDTLATQLRPRTLGELLDHAFRFYRRHFLTLIAITAVTYIPGNILVLLITNFSAAQQASMYTVTDIGEQFLSLGLYFLATLLSGLISLVLIQGIAGAAVARAVADEYSGLSFTFVGVYRSIKGQLGKLLKALFVSWSVSLLLILWLLVPCIGWLSGIGMVVFLQSAVWPLVPPVVLFEDQPKSSSFVRRAWDLVRHRLWWIIGFTLVLGLFSIIISQGPAMVITYALQLLGIQYLGGGILATVGRVMLQSLVSIVVGLLYYPLQLTAMTLLYFDLRVRYESFDLHYMATQASDGDASPEAVLAQAPLPSSGRLVTRSELGTFVLLSLAFYALVGLIIGVVSVLGVLIFQGGNW